MAVSQEQTIMNHWQKYAPAPYQWHYEEPFEEWAAVTIPAVFGHLQDLMNENTKLAVRVKDLEAKLNAKE